MALLNLVVALGCLFFLQSSWAAPPLNLTEVGEKDEEELRKLKKLRSLKQGDLTFTEDHNQFNLKIPKDAGRVLFEVKGRSLPHREGKILFRLQEGEFVKRIKDSRDKKWFMVQTYEKQPRKCWLPISSVKMPGDKAPASGGGANPIVPPVPPVKDDPF